MTKAFLDTALAADIAAGLARVETLFESQLASEFPAVNDLCAHVERYRGKMLRPTLVLVSGLAFSRDGERLPLAGAGGRRPRRQTARRASSALQPFRGR